MTDTYSDLAAFTAAVDALIGDPDCVAELLPVGIWLARAYWLRRPQQGSWTTLTIANDLYGKGQAYTMTGFGVTHHVPSQYVTRVNHTLRDDRPRYCPLVDNHGSLRTCTAPTPRKPACGRTAHESGFLTDVSTGRSVAAGGCGKHHQWWIETWRANRAEIESLGEHVPKPAANTGGVLARHLTRAVNWPKLWTALDAHWAPPAEGAPTVRPRLQILTFEPADTEFDDVDLAEPATPPALTVIRGGWTSTPANS